ncbi:DUF6114 domain-containing protein [Actinocorallia lasiicapitis]
MSQVEAPLATVEPRQGRTRRLRPIQSAWTWFRAFRRSRPFWGGLWMMVGGWEVLKFTIEPPATAISAGFGGVAGWLVGGGMILCGLIPWAAPRQRYSLGVLGTVLAIVSLIASNLGGFLFGMVFGVVGGMLLVAWGPKKPRKPRKGRRG